jgi:two-component system nitrate/nitrite response regulator NarL
MSIRTTGPSRTMAIAHSFPLAADALASIARAAGLDPGVQPTTRADLVDADIAVVSARVDGLTVLRDRRGAKVPTIVLFDEPDPDALLAAVDLGAEGILLTTAPLAAVAACIAAVATGEQWLDPEATRLISDRVAQPPAPTLTRRERDVANLVTAGQRNRAIADALGISEGTVKMHLHNVYAKFGLESRTQLAMELRARAA